jgi:hypothetical protein
MTNFVPNEEGMRKLGTEVMAARMAPVADDLNDLNPGCLGESVESVVPKVRAVCEGHEIHFTDRQLWAIAEQLSGGGAVRF